MRIFLTKKEREEQKRQKLMELLRARPYTYLFIAILAQVILLPILEVRLQFLVPLMSLLIVITVLQTLDARKSIFRICLALGLSANILHVLGRLLQVSVAESSLLIFAFILDALFMMIVIFVLGVKVLSEKKVSAKTIRGGLAIYVLLGFLWAHFYGLVLWLNPLAISFPEKTIELSGIIYFSFATLTTVGYGDITPVSWMARNLTIVEATLGQIYLAVLVARLIGLNLAQLAAPSSSEENEE